MMVSYSQSDNKIPVRPAPAPPVTGRSRLVHQEKSKSFAWDDWNSDTTLSSNTGRSSLSVIESGTVKKKPPPRPPPPKFTSNHKIQQKQTANRPSDLLSGLFFRQKSSRTQRPVVSTPTLQQHSSSSGKDSPVVATLIDLDSPSSSPTFTARSSSDGVSVNSFSSDGSNSNNSHSSFNGNYSHNESGFEDDFDLFNGFSKATTYPQSKDPWSCSSTPQDPFSPPRQSSFPQKTAQPPPLSSGNSTFFDLKFEYYSEEKQPHTNVPAASQTSKIPTIIRPKPPRPPALPRLREVNETVKENPSHVKMSTREYPFEVDNARLENEQDFENLDWSPPMPSVPPPPLPSEAFLEIDTDIPPVPPRPVTLQQDDLKKPYGIALYDYPATHPDDLALQINDIVFLLREVNSEWLFGKFGNREGIFPSNFVEVKVPLPKAAERRRRRSINCVTALYPFSAETSGDLEFPEGASISVLGKVDNDWLYGEYNGKRGQFPANFVDHIPDNVTFYST